MIPPPPYSAPITSWSSVWAKIDTVNFQTFFVKLINISITLMFLNPKCLIVL